MTDSERLRAGDKRLLVKLYSLFGGKTEYDFSVKLAVGTLIGHRQSESCRKADHFLQLVCNTDLVAGTVGGRFLDKMAKKNP